MLTTIRSKPDHIKKSIGLVVTVVIFSGIVFMWWSSRDTSSHELEVQARIVSPLDGVSTLFSGFVSGFKERLAKDPIGKIPVESVATTTKSTFDLSGAVVIDPSAPASSLIATTTKTGL